MKSTPHRHPLYLIIDEASCSGLNPGTRLRRLPHNAIIRLTDFMTAVANPPGRGLLPVHTHGNRSCDNTGLVYYRLIS